MASRSYDVVLFGATGFAGALTAAYLARNAPAQCRWALAGRNDAKLESVRRTLAAIDPALAELALLNADGTDAASMQAIAESARVVISTVGPYVLYGAPLVAACADAGTDYVDLTGEPEFVNTTYVRHHARAVQTGARLVHSCGFDSIPHDLGAYFTVLQLPEGVPLRVSGYVRSSAAISGGTFYSALTGFSRIRENVTAARQRKAVEPVVPGRIVGAVLGRPHRNPVGDGWAVPAHDRRPGDRPVGTGAAPLRPGLPLLALRLGWPAPDRRGRGTRRRRPYRPGPDLASTQRRCSTGSSQVTVRPPRSGPAAGSPSRSSARAAASASSPASPAATPATTRRRRCWPSPRCHSPSTSCPPWPGR